MVAVAQKDYTPELHFKNTVEHDPPSDKVFRYRSLTPEKKSSVNMIILWKSNLFAVQKWYRL